MTPAFILLHNTLIRRREPLRNLVPDVVTVYVCGSTVCVFDEADALRDELLRARIQREDTVGGMVWRRAGGVPA